MFEENLFRSDRNLCLGLRFSLTISQSTGQKLQIDGMGKKRRVCDSMFDSKTTGTDDTMKSVRDFIFTETN